MFWLEKRWNGLDNARNDFPNSLRRLFYLYRTSSWWSNKFWMLIHSLLCVCVGGCFWQCLLCSVFVDHPQSLLASLESLQSSQVIEEHSAQLDWIIKVTCSLGLRVKIRLLCGWVMALFNGFLSDCWYSPNFAPVFFHTHYDIVTLNLCFIMQLHASGD